MDFVEILIKSLVIGGLIGFAVGAGAARMFRAPQTQGMGAFRTLGELNACEGDQIAHFSFGLGFLFNSWASIVGAGAFTQDVAHRIIPNWAAASLLARNRNIEETLHSPARMAMAGAVVGALVVGIMNSTAVAIPQALQLIATKVLVPAANWLINLVMPIVFWMAALDAGRRTGVWATVLGGLSHLVMGNAVPGIVLGILIGQGLEDSGWNHITRILVVAVIALFVLSGFFREFDLKMMTQFYIEVPESWKAFHALFKAGV